MNLSPAGKPWKTESSQLGAEEAGYLSPGSRLRAASQGINSLAFLSSLVLCMLPLPDRRPRVESTGVAPSCPG